MSAPFHTSLMKPAAEKLALEIAATTFLQPTIPIVHNVHAQIEQDVQSIKNIVIEQIYSPVRWVACVNKMASFEVEQTVECGPGRVLSGLIKRIQKSLFNFNTDSDQSLNEAINACM